MTVSPGSLRMQKVPHKLIALCSFKEVRENFSEERQFFSMSISQIHFASGSVPHWGPQQPPDPSPMQGGFWPPVPLLSQYLHLLEILLITLLSHKHKYIQQNYGPYYNYHCSTLSALAFVCTYVK